MEGVDIKIRGACLDQSSVIDPETDLRHHAPVLGNGRGHERWAPDTPTKGLVSLWILVC